MHLTKSKCMATIFINLYSITLFLENWFSDTQEKTYVVRTQYVSEFKWMLHLQFSRWSTRCVCCIVDIFAHVTFIRCNKNQHCILLQIYDQISDQDWWYHSVLFKLCIHFCITHQLWDASWMHYYIISEHSTTHSINKQFIIADHECAYPASIQCHELLLLPYDSLWNYQWSAIDGAYKMGSTKNHPDPLPTNIQSITNFIW